MITLLRFRRLEQAVRQARFSDNIDWTERLASPVDAEEFARAAIYVIANSGMKNTVATPIYDRCISALEQAQDVWQVFGHPGKGQAMEAIWRQRQELFDGYQAATDKIEFCQSLPWVGPVTKFHLGRGCAPMSPSRTSISSAWHVATEPASSACAAGWPVNPATA